mmetsp:Transcript_4684/g.10923  ORF Transcript_4684/g.10923 Transcript_4684/m.10923 type:complete len:354 (-) Transcript_4684:779-1840(-)
MAVRNGEGHAVAACVERGVAEVGVEELPLSAVHAPLQLPGCDALLDVEGAVSQAVDVRADNQPLSQVNRNPGRAVLVPANGGVVGNRLAVHEGDAGSGVVLGRVRVAEDREGLRVVGCCAALRGQVPQYSSTQVACCVIDRQRVIGVDKGVREGPDVVLVSAIVALVGRPLVHVCSRNFQKSELRCDLHQHRVVSAVHVPRPDDLGAADVCGGETLAAFAPRRRRDLRRPELRRARRRRHANEGAHAGLALHVLGPGAHVQEVARVGLHVHPREDEQTGRLEHQQHEDDARDVRPQPRRRHQRRRVRDGGQGQGSEPANEAEGKKVDQESDVAVPQSLSRFMNCADRGLAVPG